MSTRTFFILAMATGILAVSLQVASLAQASRGAQMMARSVSLQERERVAAHLAARESARRSDMLGRAGMVSALTSAAFAVSSTWRREPVRRSVVWGVLVCYVMLCFLLA